MFVLYINGSEVFKAEKSNYIHSLFLCWPYCFPLHIWRFFLLVAIGLRQFCFLTIAFIRTISKSKIAKLPNVRSVDSLKQGWLTSKVVTSDFRDMKYWKYHKYRKVPFESIFLSRFPSYKTGLNQWYFITFAVLEIVNTEKTLL